MDCLLGVIKSSACAQILGPIWVRIPPTQISRLLLAYGADPEVAAKNGKTAADVSSGLEFASHAHSHSDEPFPHACLTGCILVCHQRSVCYLEDGRQLPFQDSDGCKYSVNCIGSIMFCTSAYRSRHSDLPVSHTWML